MEHITIFYPAFNEEAYLQKAIEAAKEVGEQMIADGDISQYDILIVDDASKDNTGSLADEMATADQKIHCIHHEINRGLGGSVKSGLTHAKGDVILYSDIDLPFDMMDLKKAYRLMRYYNADIVSAFRFDRTSEGLRRLIYSWFYNCLIKIMFDLRVKDVNFSCKLIRKKVIDAVALKSEGSFIDAELLAKANRNGFRIIQFGTDYFHRSCGVSTLSSWRVILKILKELFVLRREITAINQCQKQ
ncbi:MAG: glycosyltransferase family 2 protein [Desulfobacteraceae bacterium]|jgi:glycosyltransferase involved in cell wall biosynthesis